MRIVKKKKKLDNEWSSLAINYHNNNNVDAIRGYRENRPCEHRALCVLFLCIYKAVGKNNWAVDTGIPLMSSKNCKLTLDYMTLSA